MAQGWRGFGKERHSALKAGLAGIALAGFAGGWLGFANSHPSLDEVAGANTATTTPAPASAIPPTGTPAPAGTASATAVITANPTEPLPTFPRPKRSRGS